MQINTDLSQKLALNCSELPWLASPQKGVERVMLERDGDEVARATSLVRYAPKSSFSRHCPGSAKFFQVFVDFVSRFAQLKAGMPQALLGFLSNTPSLLRP
jgi:anti-sigma factor ChrR (cupin superfamily)